MSLDSTFTALIAAKRLHRYAHSNPAAHTIKGRSVLFANPVVSWLKLSPPATTDPREPTLSMTAALVAKLDAVLSEPNIPFARAVISSAPAL